MCLRTWAIYNRSRRVMWLLGALWVVSTNLTTSQSILQFCDPCKLWVAGNAPVIYFFTHSLKCAVRVFYCQFVNIWLMTNRCGDSHTPHSRLLSHTRVTHRLWKFRLITLVRNPYVYCARCYANLIDALSSYRRPDSQERVCSS
jgi:hypothetical protein